MSIILVFLLLAYFIWHPHSLSYITNFKESAKVLILVNLILGPTLFTIIYKKNKKNLKFDLISIALLQASFLIFGMYSIYKKHPIYAVFTIDRFTIIDARNASINSHKDNNLTTLFLSKPKLVFAKMPEESEIRSDIFMGHLFNGEPDLDGRPEYYKPYQDYITEVLKKGLSIDEILKVNGASRKVNLFLKKHGGHKNSYSYLPLQANDRDSIWVLDKKTAKPVGILNIDPWQFVNQVNQEKKQKVKPKQWLI